MSRSMTGPVGHSDRSRHAPGLPSEKDLRRAIAVLKREGMAHVQTAALTGDKRNVELADSLARVVTDLRGQAEQARVAEQGRVEVKT